MTTVGEHAWCRSSRETASAVRITSAGLEAVGAILASLPATSTALIERLDTRLDEMPRIMATTSDTALWPNPRLRVIDEHVIDICELCNFGGYC